MRNAFADQITSLAAADDRVVLLSGDIGNRLFDKFKASCPDRFFNCGVAEANIIGMASGLAMTGLRPIAYTITPFITYRCFEQIRVDLCYHDMPVVIVGVGSGLGYASLGATHHSCEDIACMRALPGMTVICPADPVETREAIAAALTIDGPVYIRLGKKGEPVIHKKPISFRAGRALVLETGRTVALLSTGTILPETLHVAEKLSAHGLRPEITSFHTVKPLDTAYLEACFASFDCVVTIEEHSLIGGFGSAVSEWLADRLERPKARLIRAGLADAFFHEAGEQEDARKKLGFSVEEVAARIVASLES